MVAQNLLTPVVTPVLLSSTAFAAGVVNSVAGGGTFLTFPALTFAGVPLIAANATSTAAVCPGALASAVAYREDIKDLGRQTIVSMVGISLVGGFVGALLLLHTPQSEFASLIPWLLLSATLLFAVGRPLAVAIRRHFEMGPIALLIGQFCISVYGGYFGAGIGILMLGMMTIAGFTDVHKMNGIKALLSGCLNAVAVVTFMLAREIYWPQAILMAMAAIVGGYAGGWVARRIPAIYVRVAVIVLGATMSLYFFLRH
ncbi:MAG TPA: sulfite exporter TauE/SafE family protein [Gemmatimonadaceae bacterium]|jgi:uncharacterized membrane protein YfcA|nr:sulfite exporter TauE/SafE family protein [Gemmatimonadaceae bacterium]